MANDLKLRVLLGAVDKLTAPLKRITGGSAAAAQALKVARDQVKALNAQQADISGYRKQQAAIAGTSQKLQRAQERLRQMRTALHASGSTASEQFHNDLLKAGKAVRSLTGQLAAQRRGLIPHEERLRAAGIAVGQLGQHEQRLREQVQAANRALAVQQERLAAVTRRQNALSKAKQLHDRQQRVVGGMASAGAASIAGGGAPLYAAARMLGPGLQFDASMSNVQAVTRLKKQSQELNALRDQARLLGGTTMFTAGQTADAQGFLAMAGFDPNAIQAAMPGMLNLAAASRADLASTADTASNILTGLGLKASQMGELGDVLVGTASRANVNLSLLGETLKYAAPLAKSYGVDMATIAAMAGKLGDAAMQGGMGGTSLRAIMNRLAAPPTEAAKALAQLNVKTADAKGNLRDLPDILKEIYEKTAQLGNTAAGGLLNRIAGAEAGSAMVTLVDMAGTGGLQALIAELRLTQGEAAQTAANMADNLSGDLTTLRSAWEDLGIELEDQQDSDLRSLTQTVTGLIRSTKAWAEEHPKLVGGLVKTTAIIAGIALTFGTLTLTLAAILAPMFVLRLMLAQVGIQLPGLLALFWKLGKNVLPFLARGFLWLFRALALNPIGLALTAIAGAAYLLYQNWEAVTGFFSSSWVEIKQGFDGGIAGILMTLTNFSPIGLLYQAFAAVMEYLGVELPSRFTALGGLLMEGLVAGISNKLSSVKEAISAAGEASINWFKEKLGIHSPSRAFAELGGFTMDGLALGMADGSSSPLGVLTGLSQQMTESTGVDATAPIAFDQRAPIAAPTAAGSDSHDQYHIAIHPSPGMDAQAIARAVRAELARAQQEKAARQRGSLTDLE